MLAGCLQNFLTKDGQNVASTGCFKSSEKLVLLTDVFVFQQDSAPANRARETVQLLQQQTPGFISPDLWPPNSPDLNPVDYRIWGLMQERVYKTAVPDVNQLKHRLIDTWSSLSQDVINDAID